MPIYSPIIAVLDQRAADTEAATMERRFGEAGTRAGEQAGSNLMSGLLKHLSSAAPEVANALSGITGIAGEMGAIFTEAGGGAVAAIAAIAVATVTTGDALVHLGAQFEEISNTIAWRTGKMGSDLEALAANVDNVGKNTASSFEKIGDIGGRVSQSLGLAGKPLEDLTKQIADLDRHTGETLNVRDFGRVISAFGIDAKNAGSVLDELNNASQRSGDTVNELVAALQRTGPGLRSLHLDLGQAAALADEFAKAGIGVEKLPLALNHAVTEFAKKNVDLKTGLQDTIDEIKKDLDEGTQAGEVAATKLATTVFGARGAQNFVDAIRQGKVTVEDINKGLGTSGLTIEEMNNKTTTLADNWKIVANNITEAFKPIGDFLYSGANDLLAGLAGVLNPPANLPYGTSVGVPAAPPPTSGADPAALLLPPPAAPPGPQPPPAPPKNALDLLLPPPGQLPPPPLPPASPADIAAQTAAGAGPKLPQIPYPVDYGQPPAAGETAQHWRDRMETIRLQHDVDEKRAEVDDLEKSGTATEEETVKAKNALIDAQLRATEGEQRLNAAKAQAIQVPYGPGFGAPPRPWETSAQYSAEQSLYEATHKRQVAEVELQQVNSSSTRTADDLVKANNDLALARKDEYDATLRLHESLTKMSGKLTEIGAKLDPDLGISKGLAGIADNLVKFVADLAAAPLLGKLDAISAASPSQGGYGAMGILGAQGAFGPSFTGLPGAPPLSASVLGPSPLGGGVGQLLNSVANQAGYSSAGYGPTAAGPYSGGYPGDAALLSHVPAGRYEQTQATDLTKGLGDCSSAVADLVNILDGRPTAGRSMSTGNEAQWLTSRGFLPTNQPVPGAFQVGFNPEHTQATLPGGTPFNWGSDAAAARGGVGGTGAWDPAFTSHFYRPETSGVAAPTPAIAPTSYTTPAGTFSGGLGAPFGGGIMPPLTGGPGGPGGPATPGFPAPASQWWQPHLPGGGAPPGGPGPGNARGGPGADTTKIGGGVGQQGIGQGGVSMTPGGTLDTAIGAAAAGLDMIAPGAGQAAQTGIKLANRAIQFGGQATGILAQGAIDTLIPFGGSQLASNSWATRLIGAAAGARPTLPNVAGKGSQGAPGQPTPGQVANVDPNAPQGGQGGGDQHNTTNINVDASSRDTGQGIANDVAWHQQQAALPPAMP